MTERKENEEKINNLQAKAKNPPKVAETPWLKGLCHEKSIFEGQKIK
jgi:hypothetical protein